MANGDSESYIHFLLLNFVLLLSLSTSLIFSIAHIFFFETTIGYVLFVFFTVFLSLFILFRISHNYQLFSALTISVLLILFSLTALIGAGNKSGLMWGLAFPVLVAFTTKYRNYNIWSLIFLGINFAVFFIPNNIEFWTKYSNDTIMRYSFAYILIYALLEFYLRLKQQNINEKEKELIETKHKLSGKDKFLSSLSYEIRTPLNNIAGIINHQRKNINENIIEEIELSVSNLAAILNKIPEKTEKYTLQIRGDKTNFNINNVIKKVIALFQTEKYSKLKFNLLLSNSIPDKIYGDRINCMQLLISTIDFLYNNSTGSTVKIDVFSEEIETNSILIKITCKTENLIFPKNIDTSNLLRDLKDLKIINQTAESLNGSLTIQKNYETFTTLFKFKIINAPAETKKDSKDINTANIIRSYTHQKINLKDASVLLVEDDVINSKVMTLNIQKLVKKIFIAENGKEALEKFSESKIDIILMDIRMPLMDGFKTTEKIREAETGTESHVPIIAVTANASSEVKKHCFEVGMDDYTTKPTNYKLLIRKMKKLLE
ncbi:MAG: response regulator [Bacteroidales bacterium]|nr:response regulator [Bacteroidales bacterium]